MQDKDGRSARPRQLAAYPACMSVTSTLPQPMQRPSMGWPPSNMRTLPVVPHKAVAEVSEIGNL